MEKELQILYKIRNLAEEKERLQKEIYVLNQQFRNVHDMAVDKKKNIIKPGFFEYLIVFIILDYLAGRIAGEYLLHTDAVVIAMALGIPFALLGLIPVRIVIQMRNRRAARKNEADHARNEKTNQWVQKENEDITENNAEIRMKITECNNRLDGIRNTLREIAPWFPECYFQPEAVNFVINQLRTGHASDMNQAFVHYEARRK